MRAAVLRSHLKPYAYKVVLLRPGQSEDYDPGSIRRDWLAPHIGRDWHLMEFTDVEAQTGSL